MSKENEQLEHYRLYCPNDFTPSAEVKNILAKIDEFLFKPDRHSDWGERHLRHLRSTLRTARLNQARKLGTHTKDELIDLYEEFDFRCVCCGVEGVVRDHIIPIFAGGSDSIENIQPLCRPCNAGKTDIYDWKRYRRDWGFDK